MNFPKNPVNNLRAACPRLLALILAFAFVAIAPARASDAEVALTKAKLLAEGGRHQDAARILGNLAGDATLPAEERARALIHMGVALDAARDIQGAADAFVRVLPTARSEEIVAFLVEAVTHVVPRAGQLSGSWREIEVDVDTTHPPRPHAVIRWPADRLPPIALPEDGFFGMSLVEERPLSEVLSTLVIGARRIHPSLKLDADGCRSDAPVSTSAEHLEWGQTLRALVNLYGLSCELSGNTLRISCGASGDAGEPMPSGETSFTLFIGTPAGTAPVTPCTASVETLAIASTDEAGLAELDAMIRRHVSSPTAIHLCGVATGITRVADLVGHLESNPARYRTVDLKEVWTIPEGARFSVKAVVGGL